MAEAGYQKVEHKSSFLLRKPSMKGPVHQDNPVDEAQGRLRGGYLANSQLRGHIAV